VLRAGVAHVPEDRIRDGLIATFSIAENLVLNTYDTPPFARGPVMDVDAVQVTARERVREFDIRSPSVDVAVSTLSGGNQQKVIIARELSRPIKLLIASQPTRGLDVGSIEYVHRRIVEARDQGVAVLIVSSELDEVLALADRIAVMFRGRVVGERGGGADRDEIGLLMAGGSGGDGEVTG
jgi:simple sugar transport system ATP-binding protein